MSITDSRYLLFINGAVLLGCAVFDFAWKNTILVALMLFLPFIDRQWFLPKNRPYQHRTLLWSIFIAAMLLISLSSPDELGFIVFTILLVALPEEWFFRAYFMTRLQQITNSYWGANITTSVFFALLHVPTQKWFGLSVFIPSLIFGWIYQQRQDIVLVILLHAVSNIVYFVFLQEVIVGFY